MLGWTAGDTAGSWVCALQMGAAQTWLELALRVQQRREMGQRLQDSKGFAAPRAGHFQATSCQTGGTSLGCGWGAPTKHALTLQAGAPPRPHTRDTGQELCMILPLLLPAK